MSSLRIRGGVTSSKSDNNDDYLDPPPHTHTSLTQSAIESMETVDKLKPLAEDFPESHNRYMDYALSDYINYSMQLMLDDDTMEHPMEVWAMLPLNLC